MRNVTFEVFGLRVVYSVFCILNGLFGILDGAFSINIMKSISKSIVSTEQDISDQFEIAANNITITITIIINLNIMVSKIFVISLQLQPTITWRREDGEKLRLCPKENPRSVVKSFLW